MYRIRQRAWNNTANFVVIHNLNTLKEDSTYGVEFCNWAKD